MFGATDFRTDGFVVSVNSSEMPVSSSPFKTSARVQIWIVAVMLAVSGMWGIIGAWLSRTWQPTILSAAMLVAAMGTVSRRWWARYLVYALSALYVGLWIWYVGRAVFSGYYVGKSATYVFISLLSLNAYLAMACYWAYVALVHLKTRDVG
jgi:hypothetical protein